jgi:sulfoxide reductase heme-binding subunit YedZ
VHLTSSPVDWYAARAAGIVAYVLLTAVVLLGLTLATKARLRYWPRFALEDVHRFGGLLIGTFVGLHVLTIAIDSVVHFSVAQLVVPFAASYRPLWTGLGIVAAELLVALAVANRFKSKLPYGFWRRTHYLNFGVWGLATVHSAAVGTDRAEPWLIALLAGCAAAVAIALSFRIGRRRVRVPGPPPQGSVAQVLRTSATRVR